MSFYTINLDVIVPCSGHLEVSKLSVLRKKEVRIRLWKSYISWAFKELGIFSNFLRQVIKFERRIIKERYSENQNSPWIYWHNLSSFTCIENSMQNPSETWKMDKKINLMYRWGTLEQTSISVSKVCARCQAANWFSRSLVTSWRTFRIL